MNGSEVERGSNLNKIAVPKFETIKLVNSASNVTIGTTYTTINLAKYVRNSGTAGEPVYKVSAAILTKDGSTRKKLERETTPSATHASTGKFLFANGDPEGTPDPTPDTIEIINTDYEEGASILITYEYETASAIQIVNSAEEFPVASVVKVLVRGYDVCDKTSPIYAYFIFPSAKFQTNYTLGMALDQNIDCNLTCSYDYCSEARELYRMVIAGEQ